MSAALLYHTRDVKDKKRGTRKLENGALTAAINTSLGAAGGLGGALTSLLLNVPANAEAYSKVSDVEATDNVDYRPPTYYAGLIEQEPIDVYELAARGDDVTTTEKKQNIRMNTLAVVNSGVLPFRPNELFDTQYYNLAKMSSLMKGSMYKIPIPNGKVTDFIPLTVRDVLKIFAFRPLNDSYPVLDKNRAIFAGRNGTLLDTIFRRIHPLRSHLTESDALALPGGGVATLTDTGFNQSLAADQPAALINAELVHYTARGFGGVADKDLATTAYLSIYPSVYGYECILVDGYGRITDMFLMNLSNPATVFQIPLQKVLLDCATRNEPL